MQNTNILKNKMIRQALDNFIPIKSGRFKLSNQIGEQIIYQITETLKKKVDKTSK